MIHLDTSALVGAFCGARTAAADLRRLVADGERLGVSTLVWYEWWRGPRLEPELQTQELIVPSRAAVPFGAAEAALAARLYVRVSRARQRTLDLAIAACAISNDAALWTLNPRDFADIPGLTLV
ncbi:MAG TPA: PIN domain-containing protein [Vicinamibacterales bacterium]|nr:PIN domain-containing protein [Vicinamibacterales bacterium]